MNNEQCKWLMKHQYDSLDNILEYICNEGVTLSTLFCTNKNSNISITHLKCIISLLLLKMFETTQNYDTATAYIKKAEEYLSDSNDALSLRILAVIQIKLDRPSQELFKKSIELYSITLNEYIDSINECTLNNGICSCYINGIICKSLVQNSELYRQLQYSIACCREALLRVHISNQEFDTVIQLSHDIINMNTRTVFGSFDDTALQYAHKVLCACYRFGYATSINIDKAYHHYIMSHNEHLPLEQWLSDYHLELLNVSINSVDSLHYDTHTSVSIPIPVTISMGHIYTNSINKSLHNAVSNLIVIDITLILQSNTLIHTTVPITVFCTSSNIIYIVNYDMLVTQYLDIHILNKLLSSMHDVVDDVIDNIVLDTIN